MATAPAANGAAAPTAAPAAQSTGTATTVVWFAARDTTGYTPKQVDAFNKANKTIQIDYQEQGATTQDLHDKFVTVAGAKDSSVDIVSMDVPYVPEFGAAGWTIPVDDILPKDEQAKFSQGALNGATYQDKLYAVPWYNNGPGLYYRKDLFDAKGLKPPKTYDDLLNSAKMLQTATAISLVIGSLCAYAIARLNFPFKNLLLALVLAIAMFPGIAIIGPLFREFNAWGLTNNYLALILPNVTFTLPICIWVLTAFFSDLPSELDESARVDGCTRMQAFVKITVPLAAPGVFTAAILLFIQAWNEFLA